MAIKVSPASRIAQLEHENRELREQLHEWLLWAQLQRKSRI